MPFSIAPAPPDNDFNRFALAMARRLVVGIRYGLPGLFPGFRERFVIHGPAMDDRELSVSRNLQEVLLRAAAGPGPFDLVGAVSGGIGISFLTERYMIHIARRSALKTVEQVRALSEIADNIRAGLRFG